MIVETLATNVMIIDTLDSALFRNRGASYQWSNANPDADFWTRMYIKSYPLSSIPSLVYTSLSIHLYHSFAPYYSIVIFFYVKCFYAIGSQIGER